MHAVLITFTSAVELDDLHTPFHDYAHALVAVPGLVMKTWITSGATVGGFHIFTTRELAESYLTGDLCATVLNNPAFSNFDSRHFQVIDDLSAITASPQRQHVS